MMSLVLLMCAITLSESSELVDRAAFIANHEFHHRSSLTVTWWQSDPNIIADFLNSYYGSVTIIRIINNTSNNNFNGDVNFKQNVFFAVDPEEFDYFLTNLNETIIYPIRVLLVITLPVNNVSCLERYTKISEDNDVSDILIISVMANENDIMLTTYTPFTAGNCKSHDLVTVDSSVKNLFPLKFNNFNGCPIKVIIANSYPYVIVIDNNTDNIRGIDTEILDIVFEKLNASMLRFLSNKSGAHAFNEVAMGEYDMSLPGVVLNYNRYIVAQASRVFKTLDIVMCAPTQSEIYSWAKILLPFFTNITPLIILSCILFLGSLVLIRRYGKFSTNIPKGIMFGTLGLLLGQDMKFETKYWLNNGVFMLWIWYCTVVRIAYQSDLVDGLQNTFLEPRLQSLAQALKEVHEFGGPEGLLLITNVSSVKAPKIMPWKDVPKYIEDISNGRRFLLMTDISLIHHSGHTVQIVEERLSSMPTAFFMRPRWGAAVVVNRRMVQLFESGFIAKIVRDNEAKPWKASARGVDPLTLNTVASCFYGLIILGFLWTVVLCIEITWFNIVLKKKNF